MPPLEISPRQSIVMLLQAKPTSVGTVPVFRRMFALEDAIGFHACSLEVHFCVTNGISLKCVAN
jgi:hypothetical protein